MDDQTRVTTEDELSIAIQMLLMDCYGAIPLESGARVSGSQSFEGAGVARHNTGLVLSLTDGTSFHLTVNRSE